MAKFIIPTDPITRAFFFGWYASQESECRRFHRKPHNSYKQAAKKLLPLIKSEAAL